MTNLRPVPLTAATFAPFGTVTELPDDAGHGFSLTIERAFQADDAAPCPVVNLVQIETVPAPLMISQLEIHPHSSQSFLALDGAPSLIVVCQPRADGQPDPATLQAFIASPQQVVTYDRGVLHHRLTPLRHPARFAMAMRQTGQGGDTILLNLPNPVTVEIK